jgi:nucleotide-binding universal stress UspA family protein
VSANASPPPAPATPRSNRLIVAGVDGSNPSKVALTWAVRQAEISGTRLLAITAWQVPPVVCSGAVPEDLELQNHAEAVLNHAIQQTVGDQSEIALNTLVEQGHPALVLVEEARHADLLVIGSRGHGEFAGMLLGSVSEYCVTHASCPVVVVPTPSHGVR